MENIDLNLIPEDLELKVEKPKFYYEPMETFTEEVAVYDKNGNPTGTETQVKGRILKKVWTDEEEIKKVLRAKRKPLLDAFDKWEKAVLRGREQDDYYIMAWYNNLKDLQESAFESIPEKIKYYL